MSPRGQDGKPATGQPTGPIPQVPKKAPQIPEEEEELQASFKSFKKPARALEVNLEEENDTERDIRLMKESVLQNKK